LVDVQRSTGRGDQDEISTDDRNATPIGDVRNELPEWDRHDVAAEILGGHDWSI